MNLEQEKKRVKRDNILFLTYVFIIETIVAYLTLTRYPIWLDPQHQNERIANRELIVMTLIAASQVILLVLHNKVTTQENNYLAKVGVQEEENSSNLRTTK